MDARLGELNQLAFYLLNEFVLLHATGRSKRMAVLLPKIIEPLEGQKLGFLLGCLRPICGAIKLSTGRRELGINLR